MVVENANSRNRCSRGCPFGAYFSSNAVTLPAAEKTGNLTIRPFSIVHSIIYEDAKGKATGVRVIDSETNQVTEFFAKVIFCNASTLGINFYFAEFHFKSFSKWIRK
jgi:choline dehydrogenase-like flavoprotein